MNFGPSVRARVWLGFVTVALCGCAAAPGERAAMRTAATPVIADRDGDGIADDRDLCPADPEDCDGFHDDDGCADLDNDEDGILDVCDQCPNEPETYNGTDDDDGCPDQARVIVVHDIRIIPHIQFAVGSHRVEAASLPLIDEIANTLLANPAIERVLIRGNASVDERDALALSSRRARSVHDLIVQRGVAADRLEIRADGSTRPLAPNITEHGRQLNRRIDFEIVQTAAPSSPPQPVVVPHAPPTPHCPGRETPPPPAAPPPGGCHHA